MLTSKSEVKVGFGVLLRSRRTSQGLSQEVLAHKVGLDRTYISGIERGTRNPTLTVIYQIAHGLSLSVSALVADLEEQMRGGPR